MPHHHAVRRYPTLYEAVFERANSLNFLRLVLASFVILSHTPYIVMGRRLIPTRCCTSSMCSEISRLTLSSAFRGS